MYLQAAPAPYSGCKGVGIALFLGSPGWLVADSPVAATASCALGAALLTYGWARAPFARLTIPHTWPTPTTSPPADAPTQEHGPAPGTTVADDASAASGATSPFGASGESGADDAVYVRRTGSTAYGRRSAFPAILSRLHAEFATPLRVQQWRRNRPEQP